MVLALTNPRHPETAKEIVIGRIHFMGWPAFVQGVASRVPRPPHAKNGNLGRAGNAQADGPQSEGGPGLRSDLSRRSPQGEGGSLGEGVRSPLFPLLPPVKTNLISRRAATCLVKLECLKGSNPAGLAGSIGSIRHA